MEKGKIIFLNGVSSSGKTTLARALQKDLSEPYFVYSRDDFCNTLPFTEKHGNDFTGYAHMIQESFFNTIRTVSDYNMNIIVDTVFCEGNYCMLKLCVLLLCEYPVLFVKLECPLDELRRREAPRVGVDSVAGRTEEQLMKLVPIDLYDLIIDTHMYDAAHNISLIKDKLAEIEKCSAFKTLAEQYNSGVKPCKERYPHC